MSVSRNVIGHGSHGFRGRLDPNGSGSGRSDADSARNSSSWRTFLVLTLMFGLFVWAACHHF